MKWSHLIILFTLIALLSCSSWKNLIVVKGDRNIAIQNAICDFLNSVKERKKDKVFFVYTKNINNDLIGVNIYGTNDKIPIITEDSVVFSYRGLPTGYFEKDGKLFYWYDSNKSVNVTDDLISTLKKYDVLDTAIVNVYIPESTINHAKKGIDYYFCKKDLSKYKRIRTIRAMGYYSPPNVKCE